MADRDRATPSVDQLLERLRTCPPRPSDLAQAAMRAKIRLAVTALPIRLHQPMLRRGEPCAG